MKTGKIVWGMIYIFIGSIFLLDNFNLIDFYWVSVWRFWPVIFILIGINMLLSRFVNQKTVPALVAAITLLTLALIGYQGSRPNNDSRWISFQFDNDDSGNDSTQNVPSYFIEPYGGAKRAELRIQGGATSFKLQDTTSSLFEADVKRPFAKYTLTKSISDSVEVLNFRMRSGEQRWNLDEMENNETNIRLNLTPVWDIHIDMGAGEAIFDLTPYKVSSLKFEGGAASFEAKIGSLQALTNVTIETGVSNVEIDVPSESGCRIVVDSGLSSKDFIGFIKQSDGSYQTSNYSTAAKKIIISLQGGLSSFEVKKY
ncbi:LiaI-LiaF-like domain-containing protein [Daejeonella sp.]|jgi:hypothetical protein|uniref:LiaI-LiaF-like domain-containing protein n=1 Tax=Daejeonella sp. TaxID=2805397 RepID=UPI0027B923C4|nr:DUF5668 domain-containing protein [Daejeonella sp.]